MFTTLSFLYVEQFFLVLCNFVYFSSWRPHRTGLVPVWESNKEIMFINQLKFIFY